MAAASSIPTGPIWPIWAALRDPAASGVICPYGTHLGDTRSSSGFRSCDLATCPSGLSDPPGIRAQNWTLASQAKFCPLGLSRQMPQPRPIWELFFVPTVPKWGPDGSRPKARRFPVVLRTISPMGTGRRRPTVVLRTRGEEGLFPFIPSGINSLWPPDGPMGSWSLRPYGPYGGSRGGPSPIAPLVPTGIG